MSSRDVTPVGKGGGFGRVRLDSQAVLDGTPRGS